eukprot:5197426-Prymnesium_polylepis.1
MHSADVDGEGWTRRERSTRTRDRHTSRTWPSHALCRSVVLHLYLCGRPLRPLHHGGVSIGDGLISFEEMAPLLYRLQAEVLSKQVSLIRQW